VAGWWPWSVGDFAVDSEQTEHTLDVGERLSDFPVDDAEEVEWHVELNQEGIDQYQVTNGHRAINDAAAARHIIAVTPRAMTDLLTKVQPGKRDSALRCGVFPVAQLLVVALRFIFLVVEVFDRFVVDQAIDGARVGGRVGLR
jgi:hypothetical protein